MPMVCPQCNRSYEQQLQCPACDARLLYLAENRSSTEDTPSPEPQWQHTPWGRILVGLVLSQGIAQGLLLFFQAGLQVTGEEARPIGWDSPVRVILIQTIHAFSLVLGGVLTGAGQRRGMFAGSVVGLLHGLITLGIQQWHGDVLPQVSLCAVPALHMAFGAVGGLTGSLIWRPFPILQLAVKPQPEKKVRTSTLPAGPSLFDGKVAWIRVALAIALVVSGVVWSTTILRFVLEYSPAQLSVQSAAQFDLISWEVAALVTFLGAALAGATTSNGFKQGVIVGIGAGVLLVGIQFAKTKPDIERTLVVATSALLLSAGGGWFGGQLFPKVCGTARRHPRIYSEAG